jgi:hypothetical protein
VHLLGIGRPHRTSRISLLLALPALLAAAALPALASPQAEADARLSYFQVEQGKTQWLVWSAAQNHTSAVADLSSVPALLFWDSHSGQVVFTSAEAVLQLNWREAHPQPQRVAGLPSGFGDLRALWRDEATRALRVIAMQRVRKADVLVEHGKTRYRLADGTSIPALSDPDWGVPFICSVLQLQGDGATWTPIARRATKDEAGETPGISVVDELRNDGGRSSGRLLASYTCAQVECRNDVPPRLVALASSSVNRKLTDDDLSLWTTKPGGRSILFGTVAGDTLHITPPVLILTGSAGGAASQPLGQSPQLGLAIEADYLLVAEELTGSHPVVADLRTGAVRFSAPRGTLAMWVPEKF